MNNYLIYQSYGSKDILNECIYSILSLLKFGKEKINFKIVIYTDQPEYFSILPSDIVSFIQLDTKTIEEYKGPQHFIFRVKIKILQDCFTRFNGNILYMDSDIYFRKPVEELFQKISPDSFLMCNNEGRLKDGNNNTFRGFVRFIKNNKDFLTKRNILVTPESHMWNAGVLGIPTNKPDILEDVLSMTDDIYKIFDSHVVEQMMFSYCLNKNGALQESTDFVFHYWNFKEFRKVLAEFFLYHKQNSSSIEDIISDIECIRPDILIKPKMEYERLPFFKKSLLRVKKLENRWKMPKYTIGQK